MNATETVKHTPGPWQVSHSGYANAPFVIFAGTRKPNYESHFPLSGVNAIAEIFHDESEQHDEQAANARLIAAAPEMLEALEDCLSLIEFYAEREMNAPANHQEAVRETRESLRKYRAAIKKAKGEL